MCLKSVNHSRKILELTQPTADWFQDVFRYYGLSGLCYAAYITIFYEMLTIFIKRWHPETLSFHLHMGKRTITLDDVSCLMHLPIWGKLLGHRRISRKETVKMMVTHLRDDLGDTSKEEADTRNTHARFSFFLKSFIKSTWRELWISNVMICKLSTIKLMHLGVTSCSWLTRSCLWIKVQPMSMWSTFIASST